MEEKTMKQFMDENFLLQSETAQKLYHSYAADVPILDYHCHINPQEIYEDRQFENITQVWLGGDHYKWRFMRSCGVDEKYITGDASDKEKFLKWAEVLGKAIGNPLFHWSHLELKKYFGYNGVLNKKTAEEVWELCNKRLAEKDMSVRNIIRQSNVTLICTTDDPVDTLEHHIRTRESGFKVKMLPTWRPDKAMAVEDAAAYTAYIAKLADVAGMSIETFTDLIAALQKRHDFFASVGCRLSDHGLGGFYADEYTPEEVDAIFRKVTSGKELTDIEISKFKSAMLVEFAVMDHDADWTQQFHYGALRNNNTRMMRLLGPDTGFDSIGDFTVGEQMSRFFDRLALRDKLPRTIIYNLNPRDNELVATMIGNFQDGRYGAGKIQFGSGWWFLDQKDGMERQMNALSNLGLLSRFVGMLTDSRSFLSYPRHEYFRRTLCNLIGNDIEQGLLPASEIDFIGREIVAKVAYGNAKEFFKF